MGRNTKNYSNLSMKLKELFCNYKETVYVLVTNHKSKTAVAENRNFFNWSHEGHCGM
jgi:hypothetical protein